MRIVTAIIAITVGVLILLGYFLPIAEGLQILLLNWAVVLAAFAALVGLLNLLVVHFEKVRHNEKGGVYSALLILAMLGTFLLGAFLGPQHEAMMVVLEGIIIPVEAALMGLLTISLLYAAIRLLRRRVDLMAITFIATAVLIFIGSATLPFGDIPVLGTLVRPWVTQVWALGGARGILIGVALGALTTGLRVLFGADRPYGGK